jgi:hypothetical protein
VLFEEQIAQVAEQFAAVGMDGLGRHESEGRG